MEDQELLLVTLLLLALAADETAEDDRRPAPGGGEVGLAPVGVADPPTGAEAPGAEGPAPAGQEWGAGADAPGAAELPRRYQVIRPHLTASGTITRVETGPDGQAELHLRPDPAYMPLVGERNFVLTGGSLVARVLPEDRGRLPLPPVGAHIRVTGTYVVDSTHGLLGILPVRDIEPVR